jgi:hypothetical protein
VASAAGAEPEKLVLGELDEILVACRGLFFYKLRITPAERSESGHVCCNFVFFLLRVSGPWVVLKFCSPTASPVQRG